MFTSITSHIALNIYSILSISVIKDGLTAARKKSYLII